MRDPILNTPVCTITQSGELEWKVNGKLHREDGPALESLYIGKYWYINGELHREDGPAVEQVNGTIAWMQHDLFHREDGPAIIHGNGVKEWYLYGEPYTFQQWCSKLNLSEDRITELMIQHFL